MSMVSGEQLKAERLQAQVRGRDVAAYMDRDPAVVVRVEQSPEVDPAVASHYRRALAALRTARAEVRRELIRELLAL